MKKTITLRNLCLIGIIATFINGFAAKVDKSVNITVDGVKRSYWLYVPDNCSKNAPVVFALHGASGHSTDKSPHFNPIADKEGFIVVYPQGEPIYFPVFGGTVTGWDATGEANKDVVFIKAILISTDSGESAIAPPTTEYNTHPIKYYSLSGTPLSKPEREITICRMSDGKVRKIYASQYR